MDTNLSVLDALKGKLLVAAIVLVFVFGFSMGYMVKDIKGATPVAVAAPVVMSTSAVAHQPAAVQPIVVNTTVTLDKESIAQLCECLLSKITGQACALDVPNTGDPLPMPTATKDPVQPTVPSKDKPLASATPLPSKTPVATTAPTGTLVPTTVPTHVPTTAPTTVPTIVNTPVISTPVPTNVPPTVVPPTNVPPTVVPTEKPKGNCGVGNGEDGDTPGCPNGRNDGDGTGPGNPGAKGGNGNNKP